MNANTWEDAQLDDAQFAIDGFWNAKQTVSDQMAEIYQSISDGSATDDDRKRLKSLREQYIALSREVEGDGETVGRETTASPEIFLIASSPLPACRAGLKSKK